MAIIIETDTLEADTHELDRQQSDTSAPSQSSSHEHCSAEYSSPAQQSVENSIPQKQTLLDSMLDTKTGNVPAVNEYHYPHALIARIESFGPNGYPVVNFVINEKEYSHEANSTLKINNEQLDQPCLITFNRGNINEPIITGLIQPPPTEETHLDEYNFFTEEKPLVIESETGILLKCGSSRIELSHDGSINIQGMHINSQAYGPNRIKGGSVKIN